jgi:hypothetical protein
MPRYLIEVPHGAEKSACEMAVKVFLETGSHYLINADWGCLDGVHKSWIIMDAASKGDARLVLPPSFRPQAEIVGLNKFTMEDLDSMQSKHQG